MTSRLLLVVSALLLVACDPTSSPAYPPQPVAPFFLVFSSEPVAETLDESLTVVSLATAARWT